MTTEITDVRAHAVRDAAERTQEYADALELGRVRPLALAPEDIEVAAVVDGRFVAG